MKLKLTTLLFSLITLTATSYGRQPAVEAVHGVISKDYYAVPQGMEVSINFKSKNPILGKVDTQTSSSTWVALIGLFAMITLPALMWFQINKSQSRADQEEVLTDHIPEHTATVAKLDDYRKPTNQSDEHKKAS